MLKKRIIACLTVADGIVVQSINFARYLPVGTPEIAVEFLNTWGIDEIVLVDIRATIQGRKANLELVRRVSKKCLVPLTVGGGVSTVKDASDLLNCGADKVAINSGALSRPELISDIAAKFGEQCVVVSIDAKEKSKGKYEVFSKSGESIPELSPLSWATRAQELGAGEILLNSVDRDGSKWGYDIDLISSLAQALSIPLIAIGGVGHPGHLQEGIALGGAAAVAAGNFFHFSEHSVITAKAFVKKSEEVRLDTYANYDDSGFHDSGRVSKKPDEVLQKLRFVHYKKEVI